MSNIPGAPTKSPRRNVNRRYITPKRLFRVEKSVPGAPRKDSKSNVNGRNITPKRLFRVEKSVPGAPKKASRLNGNVNGWGIIPRKLVFL